jgi:speckle-type POZ protein
MLKDACIEFMACSSVMDVMAVGSNTKNCKNLKVTCPYVVIEALDKTSMFCREYIC